MLYGVMATPVFINELLNFATFYFKRVTKLQLSDAIASFYHEDEIFAAKTLLNETAVSSTDAFDGWSKLINNKGSMIHRKGEGVVRRSAEADTIVSMIAVLEVNKVLLPTYASVDLNRIPPPLIPATSENTPLADVAKSLSAIMERLDALESSRTGMVAHAIGSSSSRQVCHCRTYSQFGSRTTTTDYVGCCDGSTRASSITGS